MKVNQTLYHEYVSLQLICNKDQVNPQAPVAHAEDYAWTLTHSFFVLMGGFMLYVDGDPYHTLQPDQLLRLMRGGFIDPLTITVDQINDKSKRNVVSNGIVVYQAILFLTSRVVNYLDVTLLEWGTLVFAVFNYISFAVWWHKPLDTQCPHPVYWKSTRSQLQHYIDDTPQTDPNRALPPVFRPLLELMGWLDVPTSRKLRVPTFDGSIKLNHSEQVVLLLCGLFMATIFGGIHCLAWSSAFPTYQEQALWRISAVASICAPWLGFLVGWLFVIVNCESMVLALLGSMVRVSCAMLYITGRAILLILMVATLRSLPPDTYEEAPWIS